MANGIAVQPVGGVDLASLVLSENGASYGRRVVKQPVVAPVPSRGYRPVICVPEGGFKERDVFQDGLRGVHVPKVRIECDGVVVARCLEVFPSSWCGRS
ncbi:MAG: hypothetical protein ACLRX5_10200 [Slackia sp.]